MEVAPGIRLVRAPNPSPMTGRGTNTYLLGEGALAVIDPGPAMPEHLEAILAAAGRTPIQAILVTHGHSDHLPAAYPLAARTGAPIIGHAALAGVHRALGDGEKLEVDTRPLRALETPGHTRDSLSFLVEDESILFPGDVVAGEGTVVVGRERGDLSAYLESLERLLASPARTLLPGHGPTVDDGPGWLRTYLEHRLERERQVIAALADGPANIAYLVERIYPDLDSRLHLAAGGNVQAHLWKLEDEGRAAQTDDQRWRLN